MKRRRQYAAVPFRRGRDGLRVLLITSRGTGRWIVPKGWPMRGRRPHRAAALEAYEEAGAVGRTSKRELGRYGYAKRREDGSTVLCEVVVFALEVTRLEDDWPEAAERERRWVAPAEAAAMVEEADLAQLLRDFAG